MGIILGILFDLALLGVSAMLIWTCITLDVRPSDVLIGAVGFSAVMAFGFIVAVR